MPSDADRLRDAFPFLCSMPDDALAALVLEGSLRSLAAGQFICMEGDRCTLLPLVLDGSARVFTANDGAREVTLYRIERGETCILTASCILSDRAFPAFAAAEADMEALLVPAPTFRQWVDRFPPWRHYTFDLLARRLASVIELVNEVSFHRLDARLADLLVTAAANGTVEATHEALAADLGSTREVISRLLKHFEREGLLQLGRGQIVLVEPEALRTHGTLA